MAFVSPAQAAVVATPSLVANPPNVMVIVTDDQRLQGTMAYMPKTLALFDQGGTEFTRPYTATPLCCPARGSIRSGRYAHNHGVLFNPQVGAPAPQEDAYNQDWTIEHQLKMNGYATAIVGKYWNNWPLSKVPPNFDKWATFTGGYNDVPFNVNGTIRTVQNSYSTTMVGTYADQIITGFESNDAQPWYLYLTPQAPHSPTQPEAKYANAPVTDMALTPAMTESDITDKPVWVRNTAQTQTLASMNNMRRQHIRTLMSVDDIIGNLFARLDVLGESNTLAIFTSDNGYMFGEHRLTAKRYPYTDSIAVPIYMRWPGHVAAGADDPKFVQHIDFAPTIYDALGITPTYTVDGASMLSAGARDHMYLEYFRSPDSLPARTWSSIVTSTYQYVEWYDDAGLLTFREYYDLVNDPYQLVNLLGDANQANNPDVTAVAAQLAQERTCVGLACPQPFIPVEDHESPTAPGTPSATSNVAGQVSVTWPASTDNIATTLSYQVFRDGVSAGTVSSSSANPTFTDVGLTGGDVHVYAVEAKDQSGNISERSPDSNAVTVMMPPPPPPSLFQDDFSAGFGTWTVVSNITSDAGTARAVASNTKAYLDKTLSPSISDACASARFSVATIGSGQTIVLLRLRGTGTTQIGRVFINASRGLYLKNDVTGTQSAVGTLATGYHRLQLCAVVGTGSYLRLAVDGIVRATYVTNIGSNLIAGLQVFDNANKTFTANVDDVLVTRLMDA